MHTSHKTQRMKRVKIMVPVRGLCALNVSKEPNRLENPESSPMIPSTYQIKHIYVKEHSIEYLNVKS